MKVAFRNIRLSKTNQTRLTQINAIINEYRKLNLRLTLRQLYYQLVSRDIIPNQQKEYTKLSTVLKEGRMAGVVDWNAIEDRLRQVSVPSAWSTPASAMSALISQYEKPRMAGQDNYLEVWVEKDALSGVLAQVTEQYHVPILVNRGYSSVSAIYDAYNRFSSALSDGRRVTILYLGDFDPSGVDMIRDVFDRPLEMLLAKASVIVDEVYEDEMYNDLADEWGHDERASEKDEDDLDEDGGAFDPYKALILERFKVVSIALTREQITQYNPPPNPAKLQDPRAGDFVKNHGTQSWEVDALRPEVLNAILTSNIRSRLDLKMYEQVLRDEKGDIQKLEDLKDQL